MKAFGLVPAALDSWAGALVRGCREPHALPLALSAVYVANANRTPRIVVKVLTNLGRQLVFAIGAVAAATLLAAGCGSSQGGDYGGEHPDYAKALAGSPAPLAALHRQGDELLSGGLDAYEARLAAISGYPAVVNVWASWCGPCRFEFPLFQKTAARYGKRVAFLGVDSKDSDAAAKTFLEEAPVPYPSYTDPSSDIADELGADIGLPDTAFYDRTGKMIYLKQGPYTDLAALRADVERYALDAEGEGG
jgi:cytochrome c biogenesis protein CcmG/thiol:disulfide interchange protein DsbE